jgi:hypothetical protein
MKTLIVLFLASIVLGGCVVSPLYGPYGRAHDRGHERWDHNGNRYHGDYDRDDHRRDFYRN